MVPRPFPLGTLSLAQEGAVGGLVGAGVAGHLRGGIPHCAIVTLPATLVTLGMFLFVINACIILIASNFLSGFMVTSFWWALLFSIMLTFLQSLLHSVLKEDNQS